MFYAPRRPVRASVLAGVTLGMVVLAGGEFKPAALAADAPDPDAIEKSVDKAVAYLKQASTNQSNGRATLCAVALVKAEVPADAPEVDRVVKLVLAKIQNGRYAPSQEHNYEAGLDAILLEAVDREKYKPEIESIAKYLVAAQNPEGHWNYPNQTTGGDTSITQYGILGLWAASRAGVHVPTQTWDKVALWHLKAQKEDGGFGYHPFDSAPLPTLGMSTAGTASLHVCRMFLFPKAGGQTLVKPEKKKPARRFGLLERVEPEAARPGDKQAAAPAATSYVPTARLDRIDTAINNGLGYVSGHFTIDKVDTYKFYYLYTLERLTALADLQLIGDHDWYAEGSTHLLATQGADGSWSANLGQPIDTSFAILFLVRATNKMLNRTPTKRTVGGGLLAGGRGLPEDLKAIQVKDGKLGARKVQGGIDELLSELETAKTAPVESVQKAIVEAVQLGDREALISQSDRLKKLAVDPRAEVRRTAFWALGRGRDVRIVPLLIAGLEDHDADVVVEAHNALCFLARKPQGLGAPLNPLEGLDEEATVEQKAAALAKWRPAALKQWKAWYLAVRPFDERYDLDESKAAGK